MKLETWMIVWFTGFVWLCSLLCADRLGRLQAENEILGMTLDLMSRRESAHDNSFPSYGHVLQGSRIYTEIK